MNDASTPDRADSARNTLQVPAVQRWSVGEIRITAVSDGYALLPLETVPEITPDEARSYADAAFVRPGDLQCIVNTFVIETPTRLIMFDTGMGELGAGHSGKIWENLGAAGVDPAAVDILLMSHGHPDHTSGMLREDGSAAFPNAELMIHRNEVEYWGDEGEMSRAPEWQKPWFDIFQRSVAAYEGRTTLIEKDEQEVAPGLRAAELFGHTPGHTGLHVSDGDEQLLIWTDIVHFPHLQFRNPDFTVSFDMDPEYAKQVRKRMLDHVSADRLAVTGMHLVFPGFGHVTRAHAGGYEFIPTRWHFDELGERGL